MIAYAFLLVVAVIMMFILIGGIIAALGLLYLALFGDLIEKRRKIAAQRKKWKK
jgi:hypothetical protein